MTAPLLERSWIRDGRPEINLTSRPAGPGPWDREPDKVQWIDPATGLDCLANRGPIGAWCGYVGLPPGHPWHGKGYSEHLGPDCGEEFCYDHTPGGAVRVHGGLTYADSCRESDQGEGYGICHVPFPGRPHDVWWLGFDCAHAGDLTPGLGLRFRDDVYRDLHYVRAECTHLAEQLAAVTA